MHEPGHILRQIHTRYANSWRDWLIERPGAQQFALAAPSADVIARDAGEVGAWKRRWSAWQSDHPTAMLVSTTKNTRIGPQDVFTHVQFEAAEDLAAVDPRMAKHWSRATERWSELVAAGIADRAELFSRARPFLSDVVDIDAADLRVLVRAVAWFRDNPKSGLTSRQVPVLGMHTKWLKRHRKLVLALLGAANACEVLADNTSEDLAEIELDALGLRPLPPHIDVIVADVGSQKLLGGLRSLRAPVSEIASLPLRPTTVLIVENKESALLVEDHEGLIVIHSLGNHLNALADIPWIKNARVVYWGDLDRAGIALLSRARNYIPDTRSVLMDRVTLARYIELANADVTKADPPEPNLTAGEIDALNALCGPDGLYLRLEQERLPVDYLRPILSTAITG